jgi:hypothetical protein
MATSAGSGGGPRGGLITAIRPIVGNQTSGSQNHEGAERIERPVLWKAHVPAAVAFFDPEFVIAVLVDILSLPGRFD